jgi:hypothetical protein
MTTAIAKTHGRRTRSFVALATVLVAAVVSAPAFAANITITWLDMSPVLIGGTVPSGSVFNVPGIGNVTLTYTMPAHWSRTREQSVPNIAGNVVSGPDTYSWTNHEYFGTIFTPGELGPEFASITYTFPSTLPAGTVFLGSIGLGATTSFGGGASSFAVLQSGTFLGDWVPGPGYGATQFSGGFGAFGVQNSVTGPGGSDPWWNTYLGVVRIDDAVSSITITEGLLRGDGVGLNIGFNVPGAVGVEQRAWGGIKSLYR